MAKSESALVAVTERFDLVVIGGGPAGEKGAAQAAYFGKKVALVERATEPGGAAVHTGTLPSKTLRETALYLSGYHARELYGVSVSFDDPQASVPRLIARKNAIARMESTRIRENLARHRVTYFEGQARFTGPSTVAVDGASGVTELAGDRILIATGSRPLRPPEVHIEEPDVYDSDEILHLDRLPRTLVVLGGGVIGCEYACMFAALGVKVTLVEARPALLPFLDGEIVERLRAAMERLGVEILLGTKWSGVTRDATSKGLACTLADARVLACENILFAAGRTGNTEALDLAKAGLAADPRGYMKVDEHYRTTAPHVYAVGDVIGFPALASTSMEQARVAACHAFGIEYRSPVMALLPYGIYTIPEVSCVGETEESCASRKIDYVAGRAFYRDNARGQITGDLEGMTKIIVHVATRRVIGVHVIGERATELIHIGQAVMQLGGSVDTLIDMVFNYPTLGESFKYAAYSALGHLNKRRS